MTIKPDLDQPIPDALGRVHFIGVGGAGMSAIARMCLDRGLAVSGSDRTGNANTDMLASRGARIAIGHDAAHVDGVDTVVVTSALWPDNPELLEARRRGLPVLHRSQALHWLIGDGRVVAVAGAHGKTTSTGMIVTALLHAGRSPSFVNGGVIAELGTASALGADAEFVVEADESDGSFLLYDTAVALITNVDADHLDHYGDESAFERAFVRFAEGASEVAVVSADDPGAVRVADRLTGVRLVRFGRAADAEVRLVDVTTSGPVRLALETADGRFEVALRVAGEHNAVNAAGAFAVLTALGLEPAAAVAGLERFGGTERRFELHGAAGDVRVYDDYAHHPTEVDAALTAARTVVGGGRIIAVHQPHLYSRTAAFAGEFAEVLERTADHTIVLDVFGAREDPVAGVTGALVAERFADPAHVDFIADWSAAAARVAEIARPGDFVVTLGCGDVYRIVPQLLGALGGSGASAA